MFKLSTLPGPLAWFYTHDTDIYGSATTYEPIPDTVWGRYKRAIWWMYRNPGYGFDAFVLGYPAGNSTVVGSPATVRSETTTVRSCTSVSSTHPA